MSRTRPTRSPEQELVANVMRLLTSGDYADLTITCREEKFQVHKALICSRSQYFQKALKDGVWKEGQSAVVDLKEDNALPVPMDDPVLVKYMLDHLYGLNYLEEDEAADSYGSYSSKKPKKHKSHPLWGDPPSDEDHQKDSGAGADPTKLNIPGGNALIHAQMCAFGDFYGISDLQAVARVNFGGTLARLQHIPSLIEVFELVCSPHFQGDAVLRGMLVDKLVAEDELMDDPRMEQILLGNVEFTVEVLKWTRARRR